MTSNPKTASSVSIHPSSFADELPDLSKMSLEEVVARFKDVEKKRNSKSEPESEAEVLWRVRSVPSELLSSLRVVSAQAGVSRAVLTRCMSRHVSDWYTNSLGLDKLAKEYDEVYGSIKKRAYFTLRHQADHPAEFRFVGHVEPSSSSISTIQWVTGKLSDLRELLCVTANDLLMIGFMWSLTTLENRGFDRETIEKSFEPEVFNFETLVADRKADILALRMKYEYRESINYNDRIFVRERASDYQVADGNKT